VTTIGLFCFSLSLHLSGTGDASCRLKLGRQVRLCSRIAQHLITEADIVEMTGFPLQLVKPLSIEPARALNRAIASGHDNGVSGEIGERLHNDPFRQTAIVGAPCGQSGFTK
jgi:hypothetical protein